MILGTDFRFSTAYEAETTAIELITERYNGVVFNFTQVRIKEDPKSDTATMQFSYNILNSGKYEIAALKGNKEFEQYLGLILNTLIIDTMEIENADGESDTEILDEEREV